MKTFSPTGAISAAVNATKSNWYILAAFFILIYIVNNFVSSLITGGAMIPLIAIAQSNPGDIEAITKALMAILPTIWFGSIVAGLVSDILRAGMVQACLDVTVGQKPQFSAFTRNTFDTYLHYVLCNLIVGLLTVFGLCLCFVPGIYVGVRLMLAPYYVIDKKISCLDAIKLAWSDAEGNWWNLFLFALLAGVCNIGGMLLCCVGLLYTIPMTMVATAVVYRDLTSAPVDEPAAEAPEVAPCDNYMK